MLRSRGEKGGKGGRMEDGGRENRKDRKIKKESKKRGEVNEKLVCLKTCHFYFYF